MTMRTRGRVLVVERTYADRAAEFAKALAELGLNRQELVRLGLSDMLPTYEAYELWDEFRFSDLPAPGELDR